MVEPLAGRIKWERTGDGIRVQIPERFDLAPMSDTLLVALIPVLAIDVVGRVNNGLKGWSWEKSSLALLCFVALQIGFILVRKTVLTLTPVWMTVQRGPFGINWTWRKGGFATRRLSNLRSVPSTSDWTGRKRRNRKTVQFDEDLDTRDLAKELTEAEASALIGLMLKTYHFPEDPEPQTQDAPIESS